jgi:ceramidase
MPSPAETTARAHNFRLRVATLAVAVLFCVAVAFHFPAIPQDPAYHHFADTRTIAGIPDFWNVASNALFLVFGVMGMRFVLRRHKLDDPHRFLVPVERWPYFIFFAGVALTAFGSSYYHWNPNNHTLVWDRLPMTLGFMSLLAAMIGERISIRAGIASLAALLAFGLISVEYWNVTESAGHGDLRLYALTQFGSLLMLLLMLALFPPRYTRGSDFLIALAFYALAKALEVGDAPVYRATHDVMSGHALKHIAAAFAAYWLLRMLERRVPVASAVATKPA